MQIFSSFSNLLAILDRPNDFFSLKLRVVTYSLGFGVRTSKMKRSAGWRITVHNSESSSKLRNLVIHLYRCPSNLLFCLPQQAFLFLQCFCKKLESQHVPGLSGKVVSMVHTEDIFIDNSVPCVCIVLVWKKSLTYKIILNKSKLVLSAIF